MSETSLPVNNTHTNEALENNLKELLDKMLTYFEKFLLTKEDLAALEKKLNDYENLLELVDIMNNVFQSLTEKIDEKLEANNEAGNYDELEKMLQKHENEIRNHIRIEQQLKLYADSIQAKLEESEKARDEMTEQTKAMMNTIKKDNQKLTESLKLKSEENEKLCLTVRNLEDLKRDYENKLQGIPQLHERINHLEKKSKTRNISPANNGSINVSKDTSTIGYGIENLKKLDVESEYKGISSKPEAERKSVKALGATHYTSPMKFIQKTLSNASNTSLTGNKSKEFVRVKLEVADSKHRKDLEGLKKSYQRFYNPNKTLTRERDGERERQSNSMSKTRELKAIYSIPLMTHSSNSSLLQVANLSHRDFAATKLHQRSNSHGTKHRATHSFVKAAE